jgi:heat shock protein HspQ
MARPINDDIAYQGSTLVLAVKFPKVDDKYSFTDLWTSYIGEDKKERRIKIYYYIINTTDKY